MGKSVKLPLKLALIALLMGIRPVATASAANGSVIYTYDALGRVLTASYDTGVEVIYSYDANGNRTQQIVSINTNQLSWVSAPVTPCSADCWDAALWQQR